MLWSILRVLAVRSLLASIAVTLFLPTSALSADPHVEAYRRYVAAIEAGDRTSAAGHGRLAWQEAEKKLGDDPTTAVLAYNYGTAAILSDPAGAREAFLRAKALADAGLGDLPMADLSAYLAYADFKIDGDSTKRARALREALALADTPDAEPNPDWAAFWLDLATTALGAERYEQAVESAVLADASFVKSSPNDLRARASANLIAGIGRLVPYPRTVEDIDAAHERFVVAEGFFGPQKDIETFDEQLAVIMTWDAAANAARLSLGEESLYSGDAEKQIFRNEKSNDECGIEWAKREPPRFPTKAMRRGFIGAVLLGYHFDDMGPIEQRVLAEVPTDAFSRDAMLSVQKWRLKDGASLTPECRRNRVTLFFFVIAD